MGRPHKGRKVMPLVTDRLAYFLTKGTKHVKTITVCLGSAGLRGHTYGAANLAQAQFNVGPSVEYGQLLRPSGMTSGDFNGDLDNDLATTSDGFDRVVVFGNAGDATFPAVTEFPLPSGSAPQDVIAGDLDGDLDIDLAVALRRDPDGAVRIMLNNGAGNFTLGASVPVGDRPRGLSIADIDGDNDLDLAVANRDGNSATILTNNGSGVFAAMTVATGAEPRQTAFGRLSG